MLWSLAIYSLSPLFPFLSYAPAFFCLFSDVSSWRIFSLLSFASHTYDVHFFPYARGLKQLLSEHLCLLLSVISNCSRSASFDESIFVFFIDKRKTLLSIAF